MGFSDELILWYHQNKRDLPWRKSKNPYQIWLSEIILQQTRVEQGLAYYLRFLENYPNIDSLAQASEASILKLWQGLGYYSRARNLHSTAKYIVENHKSKFPNNYNDILKLKGVGEYTAAAIVSFAFNLPYPTIDGNVYRFLSRFFGIKQPIDSTIGKKEFKNIALELIDKKNPAIFNQAIMEFGSLQCKPKNPNCKDCPFKLGCYALKNKLIEVLPIKEKKIKQRNRYFNYLVITDKKTIYIKERTEKDIWKGLFDFPLIETSNAITDFNKMINESLHFGNLKFLLKKQSVEYKHILSHQIIYATFWLTSSNDDKQLKIYTQTTLKEINKFPVPKLIENYLKTLN